ncbi:MAG: PhzF family phenazine biosynthesis protein [bacterium]|nr:PhzF family phenazine biosynthesis protein [bacterium]
MKKLPFKKIDAFTTGVSPGNPAGYISLNSRDELTDAEMLQIARELKNFVNEVGFACVLPNNSIALKYYSAEREVEFCGHATIAIMYDILKNDANLREQKQLTLYTNKEKLAALNTIKDEDAVFIYSPAPEFKNHSIETGELLRALAMDTSHLNTSLPVSVVNAGLHTLLVPVNSLEQILSIAPDIDKLKEFCVNNTIDIIEVFTDDVFNSGNNYRTRVFAPRFGYLEDPATGSGNSALGYYLRKNAAWKTDALSIEQSSLKENYNLVKLKVSYKDDSGERILFGGPAVVRIEGSYFLY